MPDQYVSKVLKISTFNSNRAGLGSVSISALLPPIYRIDLPPTFQSRRCLKPHRNALTTKRLEGLALRRKVSGQGMRAVPATVALQGVVRHQMPIAHQHG